MALGGFPPDSDRLIAVAVHCESSRRPESLKELNPRVLDEVEAFFREYSMVDGKERAAEASWTVRRGGLDRAGSKQKQALRQEASRVVLVRAGADSSWPCKSHDALRVIASAAKQSTNWSLSALGCFVAPLRAIQGLNSLLLLRHSRRDWLRTSGRLWALAGASAVFYPLASFANGPDAWRSDYTSFPSGKSAGQGFRTTPKCCLK